MLFILIMDVLNSLIMEASEFGGGSFAAALVKWKGAVNLTVR